MKKGLFAGLSVFVIFLLSVFVVEALTINTPATAGSTLNGSYTFNVTSALPDAWNCTFATTADGVFANVLNWTAEQSEFNVTNNTALLTDAEDTTLTVVCNNDTVSESGTRVINIDNTVPTCSYSLDIDIVDFMDAQGVKVTDGSSDTTDITYLFTLTNPAGKSQDTSTSSSPSFNLEDFDQPGEFLLDLVVTDEAGTSTACANQSIQVQGSEDDATTVEETTKETTTPSEKDWTGIVIAGGITLLAVLAVLGYFGIKALKEGKGKKRK